MSSVLQEDHAWGFLDKTAEFFEFALLSVVGVAVVVVVVVVAVVVVVVV